MTSRLLKPGVATVMTGAKMWATVGDKVDAGGPYQAPNLEDPIQLNGTVRFEADPNPSILWEIESGPGGGIFEPSANVEDPTFLPNAYGTYILKLTGDPTPGAPLSDTATMFVYDAPIVDAGGPYSGTVSTPIQLNGTIVAGSDPAPAAKWLIVLGGTGSFSDAGIEDPTFTPDQEGAYVLKLEAATIDAPLQSDTADLTSTAAPAFLIQDTFTDIDGTLLIAHTPDIDTVGGGWITYQWADATPLAVAEIQSNQCSMNSAASGDRVVCVIDSGAADITVSAKVQFTAASSDCGIMIRHSRTVGNRNDGIGIRLKNTGTNTFSITEILNNAPSDLATVDVVLNPSTEYTVEVIATGTSVTATLNGGNQISTALATLNETVTTHGFYRLQADIFVDDFEVSP